jgi:16S rRNA G966 N2-methylase RsmD
MSATAAMDVGFTEAYRSERAQLYLGNMARVLAAIPQQAYGVVLTDPPYIYWKHIVEADRLETLDRDDESAWMATVFDWALAWLPALREMRPGVAWFFVEPHYAGAYLRVARYLRWPMVGWWPTLPTADGRIEYVLAFSDWWTPDVAAWAVVSAALAVDNTYGQAKVVRMLGELLRVSPAGPVLDPFMGSGTTVEAALRAGRAAVGIEMDDAIMAGAVARVRAAEGEASCG